MVPCLPIPKVLEAYFILPPDVPKDSSTELTCLSRVVDLVVRHLDAKGIPIPEHLIVEVGSGPTRRLLLFKWIGIQ